MTGRPALLLVRPSARVVPFAPLLVAFGLGLLIVALSDADAPAAVQLPRLRGVALLFAVAVAFAFDDPAADVADASPLPRFMRAMVRATVQIVPAITMWFTVLALISARSATALPVGLLSLEAAAMVMVGWAVASWWRRARGETHGGIIAAPALIVLVLVAQRLPPTFALFAVRPETLLSHERRWIAVLAVAMASLGLALRDPLSSVRQARPTAKNAVGSCRRSAQEAHDGARRTR